MQVASVTVSDLDKSREADKKIGSEMDGINDFHKVCC